jgi:hypothetical protein
MGSIPSTSATTNKSAQPTHGIVQSVPTGAVSLRVLRTVEGELRRRKMIGGGSETVTPLWFLAETERNIFLWRQGKSLDDVDDFEFWVDVPALLQKRSRQLEHPQGLNPFTNPLWGSAPLDARTLDQERNYVEDIEALADVILPHAEALSRASATVQQELTPRVTPRAMVLLPVPPGKRK